MSFFDKVVLITGGSAGVGATTAKSFAKEGANVVIVGRNEEKIQNVAEVIRSIGQQVLVIKADVTKEEETKTIISKTINKFGKLDILVNNAATAKVGSILAGTVMSTYDEIMDTNLRAPVILTALAAPYLIETKGNIVNVTSVLASTVPYTPEHLGYSVSKAGLEHFTRCAALELAPFGVRVNSLKPGPILTDMLINTALTISSTGLEEFTSKTALQRFSDPEEIADLILFLCSDKAKSVTGASYLIDNGLVLKGH